MDCVPKSRSARSRFHDAHVFRRSRDNVVPLHAAPRAESPLDVARRRYGKPFAHERGSRFVWGGGPTVLSQWLAERTLQRQADERPKLEVVKRLASGQA